MQPGYEASTNLDSGLDYGLHLDSIVFQLCNLMETMNAGLPNEQGIGITVGNTFVQLSARLAGWFKPSLCSYSLPAQVSVWQGLIGVVL